MHFLIYDNASRLGKRRLGLQCDLVTQSGLIDLPCRADPRPPAGGASFFGRFMRNRLLASLIVCVALMTQAVASLGGAAAARDLDAHCSPIVRVAAFDAASQAPQAPAAHHHDSCPLCQIGFATIGVDAPFLPVRRVAPRWRAPLPESGPPLPGSDGNRNALARAPPSRA
jgi:hypothetical protein